MLNNKPMNTDFDNLPDTLTDGDDFVYSAPSEVIEDSDELDTTDTLELARQAADSISDIKGENIIVLDIHKLTSIADYFVICNGTSDRQIGAIVERVRTDVKDELGIKPTLVEGNAANGWILMDYAGVIVHVFSEDMRVFYDLEGFWQEGKIILRMQ